MPRKFNKQKKLHVKKGDMVKVISGASRGKGKEDGIGKVLMVFPETERVLVEGINVRVKHQKPNQEYPQGGRLQKEMPIHVSNVMPLDPVSNEPTRVGRKKIEENGKSRWVRYSKLSGEVLDK
ncbi:MAG: 50S ribosomal protein L24 [Balneolales bacterium]|nr:50S ribosomal protein L24 [Balneolales bacterium]